MATATLFVRFKSEEFADSQSFDPGIVYPVYEVDIEEDDQGTSTVFLLANRAGDFKWIKMDDVRRASPPRQGGGGGNSGFFKKGQRDRRRDNRREEKSGNARSTDNPYAHRDSILGGREPGSLG